MWFHEQIIEIIEQFEQCFDFGMGIVRAVTLIFALKFRLNVQGKMHLLL